MDHKNGMSYVLEETGHMALPKGSLKADSDDTILTYDCRMQLAHVIHTTWIASCKSTSQLPQDCRIQLEKSCRILKHVSKPCDNSTQVMILSKLHATVVSQSFVI